MRPESEGGVAAGQMVADGRPSLWHTPTPYLFLGFGFMMLLIAVALSVLICARCRPSRRGYGDAEAASTSARAVVPLDREPKVVVVMAGDTAPSFLASAKPLAAAV